MYIDPSWLRYRFNLRSRPLALRFVFLAGPAIGPETHEFGRLPANRKGRTVVQSPQVASRHPGGEDEARRHGRDGSGDLSVDLQLPSRLPAKGVALGVGPSTCLAPVQ